jgi:tetratricopeptide (TPR) repeat protein
MHAKTLIPLLVAAVLESAEAFGGDALRQASSEIDAGRFEAAVRLLDERLERQPSDVAALKARALASGALGRYEAAARDYEAALEEDPGDADVHRDLGMLLAFKAREIRHAAEHLDRYLALVSESDIPAEVIRVLKSLDQKCSKREHHAAEELLRMARAFEEEGKARLAVEVYGRALKIRPACAPCHESLGRLLKDERHLARARLLRGDG